MLEATLQRLGAREQEVQQELQLAQKLQGSFTGELFHIVHLQHAPVAFQAVSGCCGKP